MPSPIGGHAVHLLSPQRPIQSANKRPESMTFGSRPRGDHLAAICGSIYRAKKNHSSSNWPPFVRTRPPGNASTFSVAGTFQSPAPNKEGVKWPKMMGGPFESLADLITSRRVMEMRVPLAWKRLARRDLNATSGNGSVRHIRFPQAFRLCYYCRRRGCWRVFGREME